MSPEPECPDCGCAPRQHNAVNRVPAGLIPHCGACGACWTAVNSAFVEIVRRDIQAEARD